MGGGLGGWNGGVRHHHGSVCVCQKYKAWWNVVASSAPCRLPEVPTGSFHATANAQYHNWRSAGSAIMGGL